MESAPNPIIGFLVLALSVVSVPAVVILVLWGCSQGRKNDIAAAVRNLGAIPLSINWSPRFFAPNGSPPQYQVSMRLHSGQVVTALCQCSLWTGVYWKDTPWLRLPPDHASFFAMGSCRQCGYTLREGWHCCPKCGTAIASQPPPMPSTTSAPRGLT